MSLRSPLTAFRPVLVLVIDLTYLLKASLICVSSQIKLDQTRPVAVPRNPFVNAVLK